MAGQRWRPGGSSADGSLRIPVFPRAASGDADTLTADGRTYVLGSQVRLSGCELALESRDVATIPSACSDVDAGFFLVSRSS